MDVAKIFMSGRSQAVRLPKEYRFDTTEVYIRRIGNAVMLVPKPVDWKAWFSALASFDVEVPAREQPARQQDRPALDEL
ncbi:MAG: antitoxin [Rubrivivax sp.]